MSGWILRIRLRELSEGELGWVWEKPRGQLASRFVSPDVLESFRV